MYRLYLLCVLVAGCCCQPSFGLYLFYSEKSKTGTVEHTLVIEATEAGYSVTVLSRGDAGPPAYQELETDLGLSVLSWLYRVEEAATEVRAVRKDSTILLSGRFKGKSINTRFRIDAQPWYQLFPHGLEHIVRTRQRTQSFWAIGYEGIGAMRLGRFFARRGELEALQWNGQQVEAFHVHISLAGLSSILWSGDYWHRPEDGRILVARSDRGPATGKMRMELTGER